MNIFVDSAGIFLDVFESRYDLIEIMRQLCLYTYKISAEKFMSKYGHRGPTQNEIKQYMDSCPMHFLRFQLMKHQYSDIREFIFCSYYIHKVPNGYYSNGNCLTIKHEYSYDVCRRIVLKEPIYGH